MPRTAGAPVPSAWGGGVPGGLAGEFSETGDLETRLWSQEEASYRERTRTAVPSP